MALWYVYPLSFIKCVFLNHKLVLRSQLFSLSNGYSFQLVSVFEKTCMSIYVEMIDSDNEKPFEAIITFCLMNQKNQ